MGATQTPTSQALRGKRYLAYARCAAEAGSAPKLQEQVRLIRQFGDSLAMKCVGEVRLAGVGGGAPALRPDLLGLLARKRNRDDFDVLIVEDAARLTRTGMDGILEIETRFGEHGVQIVCLTRAMQPGGTAPGGDLHNPPAGAGH